MKTKWWTRTLIHICFTIFSLLCLIPLVAILSISFSSESDIALNGYRLFPKAFDLTSYKYILNVPTQILNAYSVSITVTVFGTLFSLLFTAGIAYALSRKDFKFRNTINFLLFFTMLFNGGLVPTYMLITNILHLKDSLLVLILPYLISPWFVFLLRTFMQKIPYEIIESCSIDGASEFRIFFQMIIPLAKPGLATIALLTSLLYWNDWWLSLLYIDSHKLAPLQSVLYRMMATIDYLTNSTNAMPAGMKNVSLPRESARMAMAVLAAGPMMFVFPFFQKYFVKGLTVGSVKG